MVQYGSVSVGQNKKNEWMKMISIFWIVETIQNREITHYLPNISWNTLNLMSSVKSEWQTLILCNKYTVFNEYFKTYCIQLKK